MKKKPSHHENTLKMKEREKMECKVIGEYWDKNKRCKVTVLQGVQDRPMRSIPVGGEE